MTLPTLSSFMVARTSTQSPCFSVSVEVILAYSPPKQVPMTASKLFPTPPIL